jgi:cob(I)alamin adenosyltransferase
MNDKQKRILVFTGDGKGKTTAALGMALRAHGHSIPVLIVQFVKANEAVGEIAALRQIAGMECVQFGLGFLPRGQPASLAQHRLEALRGLEYAAQALSSDRYGLVVLDEICLAVASGLLLESEVKAVLQQTHANTCVVLTGRAATPGLMALADTVSEVRCCKHGYQQGIAAQPGVEY